MHKKARPSLLTARIADTKGLSFTELKPHCGLTDGNLSIDMRELQDRELIEG